MVLSNVYTIIGKISQTGAKELLYWEKKRKLDGLSIGD